MLLLAVGCHIRGKSRRFPLPFSTCMDESDEKLNVADV